MHPSTKIKDLSLVAFDIETSGSYPLESEICELAAVKWQNGKIVDEYKILIKPTKLMSDFIIGIHGITNEMVANSPRIEDKIHEFYNFIQGSVVIAHHSPFDMGFVSIEFEKQGLLAPSTPALCTSLLARRIFPDSVNHKLQTLVAYFNIPKNQAHRAYDDAIMCLNVALKCFEKVGWEKTLKDLYDIQARNIAWQNFYFNELKKNPTFMNLIDAVQKKQMVRIIYRAGLINRDEKATVHAVVRSPDGDFIFAHTKDDPKVKRFYLSKVIETELIAPDPEQTKLL